MAIAFALAKKLKKIHLKAYCGNDCKSKVTVNKKFHFPIGAFQGAKNRRS